MRLRIVICACFVLTACTTTMVRQADVTQTHSSNARVLALQPDVELNELTATGLADPRADWSTSARDNLTNAVKAQLDAKGLKYTPLDPTTVTTGHLAQVLRLNDAVSTSIQLYSYGLGDLPTHKGGFNWTLGDGAKDLGDTYQADYALCIVARGSYSTNGRKMMFIAMAAAGVAMPMGGQTVLASIVDLKTGRIVWNNLARASPDADMRSVDGARQLMADVLKSAPL